MRFVQIKSAEQQGRLMLHRTRDLLMRQRTQLINALRAHMAELGVVAAQGNAGLKELLKIIAGERDVRLPLDAHASLVVLAAGLHAVQTMIRSIDKRIIVEHRSNEAGKRLRSIPGIGVVGASAIVATVQDPKVFRSGRDFAAWIGLVPREDSTGGKQKLGPVSKQGIAICDGFWWSEPIPAAPLSHFRVRSQGSHASRKMVRQFMTRRDTSPSSIDALRKAQFAELNHGMSPGSLQLDARQLDHVGPLLNVFGNELAEFGG